MKITPRWVGGAVAALLTATSAAALQRGDRVAVPCPLGDCSAGVALTYLGEQSLPWDTKSEGIPFGGISGLDFDPHSGRYLAISDDRAEKGPARFYALDLKIGNKGFTHVSIERTVLLKDPQGQPFAAKSVDPEAIRLGPEGNVYWTSEGSANAGLPTVVRVADRAGRYVRAFTTPKSFAPDPQHRVGIRDNLAFEGVTLLPNGEAIAAMETALYQDGPIASLMQGSLARFVRYRAATGEPLAEYVYPVSPIPQPALKPPFMHDNGVSEVLALDDHHLLVLERSYASGYGNTIKVFLADLAGATDVQNVASLLDAHEAIVPIRKTQLLDFRALGLTPDNLESMALGKTSDGREVLVFAADDNFSPHQTNQFYAFRVERRPH